MKAEIRADGLHISGYVNVPGRESRPVVTRHGKVIEVIEQRAFQRAIEKADNIDLMLDHEKKIASTSGGTLNVYEDAVGLRAEAGPITDEETVEAARKGKLRGWSFNMINVKDEIEERAGQLPLRRVKEFDMTEITLAYKRTPFYSSTSIEIRAGEEAEIEVRSEETEIIVKDMTEKQKKPIDYSPFEERIKKLSLVK